MDDEPATVALQAIIDLPDGSISAALMQRLVPCASSVLLAMYSVLLAMSAPVCCVKCACDAALQGLTYAPGADDDGAPGASATGIDRRHHQQVTKVGSSQR
jgi:hypothetical protein